MATEGFWAAAPPVLQAISVAVTAYFAVRSLNAWRIQLAGKRRFEVAEETVVAAHRVAEALNWIRNPAAFASEGKERQRDPGETEAISRTRDNYFVPIQRAKDTSEQFVQLSKIRLLAKVYFGRDIDQYANELYAIRSAVIASAWALIGVAPDHEARQRQLDFYHRCERDIWAIGDDEDRLSRRTAAAINGIEEVCLPYLQAAESRLAARCKSQADRVLNALKEKARLCWDWMKSWV